MELTEGPREEGGGGASNAPFAAFLKRLPEASGVPTARTAFGACFAGFAVERACWTRDKSRQVSALPRHKAASRSGVERLLETRQGPLALQGASAANAAITAAGACTSSSSTPSPERGASALGFGCTKHTSCPAAPLRIPPGVKRSPRALSQRWAAARSSTHNPKWFSAGS